MSPEAVAEIKRMLERYAQDMSLLSDTFTYAPVNLAMEAEALMADLRANADEICAKAILNSQVNSSAIVNGDTFNRDPAE